MMFGRGLAHRGIWYVGNLSCSTCCRLFACDGCEVCEVIVMVKKYSTGIFVMCVMIVTCDMVYNSEIRISINRIPLWDRSMKIRCLDLASVVRWAD